MFNTKKTLKSAGFAMIMLALALIAVITVASPEAAALTLPLPLLFGGYTLNEGTIKSLLGIQPGEKTAINYFDVELVDSQALATADVAKTFFPRQATTTAPVNYESMGLPFSKTIIYGIRFWAILNHMLPATFVAIMPGMVKITKGTIESGRFALATLMRPKMYGALAAASYATDGYAVTWDTNPYKFIKPIVISDTQTMKIDVTWTTAVGAGWNGVRLACSLYGVAIDKMEKQNA